MDARSDRCRIFEITVPLPERAQESSTAWVGTPDRTQDWGRSRRLNQCERLASGREVAQRGQQSKVSLALLESRVG